MGIFRGDTARQRKAQGPFEKLLLPSALLLGNPELDHLCYEDTVFLGAKHYVTERRNGVHYLTAPQFTKASQQKDLRVRAKYVRENFRKNFEAKPDGERDQIERSLYHALFERQQNVYERKPRVLVVVTGGTGFCRTEKDGLAPNIPVNDILGKVPFAFESYEIVVEDLGEKRFDSSQAKPEEQQVVAEAVHNGIVKHKPDGVVVAHGTDTMANAANVLSLSARWPIPVVFTGAMIAGEGAEEDGKKIESDIFPNLRYSFLYSALPIRPGVYVSFAGELHEGSRVSHPYKDKKRAFKTVWNEEMGSCGRFYPFKDLEQRKLKPIEKEKGEPSDLNDFSNLGLCPRVLDPRLDVPDDFNKWSEAYLAIIEAAKSVESGRVSSKREYSNAPEPRLIAGRPKIKGGIISFPESEYFEDQLASIPSDRALPIRERKGVYIDSFSGNVRAVDVDFIMKLVRVGTPIVFGSKVLFDSLKQASAYSVARDIRDLPLLYTYGMTKDMSVSKVTMIMKGLADEIEKTGNHDLEEPAKYLSLVESLMKTDFEGEIDGRHSQVPLSEAIEVAVATA